MVLSVDMPLHSNFDYPVSYGQSKKVRILDGSENGNMHINESVRNVSKYGPEIEVQIIKARRH